MLYVATVSRSGPLLSGTRKVIIDRMVRDIADGVTREAGRRVQVLGQSMFRYADKSNHHVPGKWRSRIHAESRGNEGIVTDSGIVYGPWLEGVGSRNQTTRFKGYRMWRTTFQNMDRSGAREVYRPIVDRAVRELNG